MGSSSSSHSGKPGRLPTVKTIRSKVIDALDLYAEAISIFRSFNPLPNELKEAKRADVRVLAGPLLELYRIHKSLQRSEMRTIMRTYREHATFDQACSTSKALTDRKIAADEYIAREITAMGIDNFANDYVECIDAQITTYEPLLVDMRIVAASNKDINNNLPATIVIGRELQAECARSELTVMQKRVEYEAAYRFYTKRQKRISTTSRLQRPQLHRLKPARV